MNDENPHGPSEEKPSSGKLGRRGFIITMGFGVAASALLRKLPSKTDTKISQTAAEKVSFPTTSTSTTLPSSSTTLNNSELPNEIQTVFETVISGGRVIDPDSGYDAVANIGIEGKTIKFISIDPLNGKTKIDATGLVVSPGFIDVLSYPTNGYGEWYKIADGVTSNLCMHGIDNPMQKFLESTENHNPPVNYGGAVDHYEHRKILGVGIQKTSLEERSLLLELAEKDLQAGAIGIHHQPEYTVDLKKSEIIDHGRLAAKYEIPLCLHLRHSYDKDFGSQENAIDEALEVARETGCSVHIEHLNSTGGTGRMREAISQIQSARDEGLAITACIYPYTFWATYAGSARFDNFQNKFGISFEDLQEVGKPARMTEETFSVARKDNKLVAAFAMSEEDITDALSAPWVLIGSDSILERPHNNHPRSAGCFSRFLGTYVREREVLTLPDALGRITILPSRLLEKSSSSMKNRGRIQPGAIADITMFDPQKISDRADVSNPAQESVGIVHVMVNGQLARNNSKNNNVKSGVPILRDTL